MDKNLYIWLFIFWNILMPVNCQFIEDKNTPEAEKIILHLKNLGEPLNITWLGVQKNFTVVLRQNTRYKSFNTKQTCSSHFTPYINIYEIFLDLAFLGGIEFTHVKVFSHNTKISFANTIVRSLSESGKFSFETVGMEFTQIKGKESYKKYF